MDTLEKYEDSYAIAEEFREWILHIGEDNENLQNSVLNFPNKLKELLDQKVNEKLIEWNPTFISWVNCLKLNTN